MPRTPGRRRPTPRDRCASACWEPASSANTSTTPPGCSFASKRQRRSGGRPRPSALNSNPAAPFERQNLAPACGSLLEETAAAVIATLSLIGRVIGTGETLPALAPPRSSLAAVLTTLAQAPPPSRLWLIGSRCHGAFLVRPADPTPGAHGCANSAACRRVTARPRLHERVPNPGPRGAALAYEGGVPFASTQQRGCRYA